LKHGFEIPGSGALHSAAELGALDVMRVLLQHGADLNELLGKPCILRREDGALLASGTPMHFAAAGGQDEAMGML
jgi:ankyrin repeat protein